MHHTRAALAAVVAVAAGAAAAPGRASASEAVETSCGHVVTGVEPATSPQQKWAEFGAGEWAGGDGTYSVPLPNGRTAWLFNDTFLGPVGPGRSIRPQAPVHNTMVTAQRESERPLHTIVRGTAQDRLPVVGPAGTDRPWY